MSFATRNLGNCFGFWFGLDCNSDRNDVITTEMPRKRTSLSLITIILELNLWALFYLKLEIAKLMTVNSEKHDDHSMPSTSVQI